MNYTEAQSMIDWDTGAEHTVDEAAAKVQYSTDVLVRAWPDILTAAVGDNVDEFKAIATATISAAKSWYKTETGEDWP